MELEPILEMAPTALWTFINYKRTMLSLPRPLPLGAGFLPDRQTDRPTGQTWPEDDDDRAKTKANVNEPREWREP